jgi:hypothetical protein
MHAVHACTRDAILPPQVAEQPGQAGEAADAADHGQHNREAEGCHACDAEPSRGMQIPCMISTGHPRKGKPIKTMVDVGCMQTLTLEQALQVEMQIHSNVDHALTDLSLQLPDSYSADGLVVQVRHLLMPAGPERCMRKTDERSLGSCRASPPVEPRPWSRLAALTWPARCCRCRQAC